MKLHPVQVSCHFHVRGKVLGLQSQNLKGTYRLSVLITFPQEQPAEEIGQSHYHCQTSQLKVIYHFPEKMGSGWNGMLDR